VHLFQLGLDPVAIDAHGATVELEYLAPALQFTQLNGGGAIYCFQLALIEQGEWLTDAFA